MSSWIRSFGLVITVPLLLYASFSSLTYGRYTPTFYAYQLDRALGDRSSTRLCTAWCGLICAVGLIFPQSRAVAASLCALVMFGDILQRTILHGQNAAVELALMLILLIISLDTLLADE